MRFVILAVVALLMQPSASFAQAEKMNFSDRQAVVINNAQQFIELSGFQFENKYRDSRLRLITDLTWKNTSSKAITAFDVVIIRYDPFNRPISGGGRWMITGNNSGDWRPLAPGATSSDGLISFNDEPVFTAIAYVRAIRFVDGTVWYFNQNDLEKQIKAKLPALKELGDVNPGSKAKEK